MRRIIEGILLIGIFLGFAMLDSNFVVGAALSILCMGMFFVMEKGIL